MENKQAKMLFKTILASQEPADLRCGVVVVPQKLLIERLRPVLTKFGVSKLEFVGTGAKVTAPIMIPLLGSKEVDLDLKNIVIEKNGCKSVVKFVVCGAAGLLRMIIPHVSGLLKAIGVDLNVHGDIWELDISDKITALETELKGNYPEFTPIITGLFQNSTLRAEFANEQLRITPHVSLSAEHKTTSRLLFETIFSN